jgi:hypothetical protein
VGCCINTPTIGELNLLVNLEKMKPITKEVTKEVNKNGWISGWIIALPSVVHQLFIQKWSDF